MNKDSFSVDNRPSDNYDITADDTARDMRVHLGSCTARSCPPVTVDSLCRGRYHKQCSRNASSSCEVWW